MPLHTVLNKAIIETAKVVRGVEPDQFGAPTPCRDWDVRALTNHLLQVVHALQLAGRRLPVPGDLWDRALIDDGWAAHFDDAGSTAIAAWVEGDAWEGGVTLGDMRMPAPAVAAMLVSDLAIHGWDLARATGQTYRCDDDLAEVTYRFLADMGDQGRRMGIYAAPLPPVGDARTFEQALALSGRDPGWAVPVTDGAHPRTAAGRTRSTT
ncbi:TIGR03086 family metal-binding protein [Micromonospora sp. NPDC049799]|uniref:TIGR03086 family metal-binding protein n=1 Tax=Micromonospora sp. NPDC049799 TaxID=3154741 RepID=UPI0034054F39